MQEMKESHVPSPDRTFLLSLIPPTHVMDVELRVELDRIAYKPKTSNP